MKSLFLPCLIVAVALCGAPTPALAQIGAFSNNMDIGAVAAAGSATAEDLGAGDFGARVYEYVIKASGEDIWGTADEFHFVYMEAEGDFTIFGRTDIDVGGGDATWAKSGLMVRDNLTPGSPYAYAMFRSNMDFMGQWRDSQGGSADWGGDSTIVPADQIRGYYDADVTYTIALERRGTTFNFYYVSAATGQLVLAGSHVVPGMQDPVYVGMAVTSHNDGQLTTAYWRNVGIEFRSFNIYETFSYPDESPGTSLSALAANGGLGWAGNWTASGANSPSALDSKILEAGLVENQPAPEFNIGGYSAKITGDASNGIGRRISPEASGDIWISFVFQEEGPAADHWSGMTLYASDGSESSFIGKPYNAAFCGIGNLPGGDSLTNIDYKVPNHFLVRISLDPTPGQNDSVYLWINPDENDRLDTYDAGGAKNDNILDIAEVRLRRGGATGSSYFDNIWISSDAALPPAGAGRVDLTFNNPNRDPAIPAWDVISIDKYDDAIVGQPGFGHDNGNNYYLVVAGYIYENASGVPFVANGLPPDRMSGLNGHVFGPYNNASLGLGLKNSIKFMNNDAQRGPFTFDMVPPGRYRELRMAATVGNGFGALKTTLNYADGSTEVTELHADDWFRDPADSSWQYADVRLLINGMDRLDGSSHFADANDPAVNEDRAPVNPDKVLVSVTLELDTARSASNPGFNLYDIWALPAEGATGVADWSLF
ncbi:MAG: hypothetical protein HPY51_02095 [Candidatus Omnitrophica bacterium]|nr:hypothetical protein [Candidatus Omnitrophota bacterium]